MKLPSCVQLVLLVCALDATVTLAAPIPVDPYIKERNLDVRDVDVRNVGIRHADVITREPIPAADVSDGTAELDERNVIGAVVQVGKMIAEVVSKIKEAIAADKENRSKWTFKLVEDMYNKDHSFNYIVCHTKHRTNFWGVQGKDWYHRHEELPMGLFKKTTGFEIYGCKNGTFTREGDGGYLNWAYKGLVKETKDGGKTVIFNHP